MMVVIACVRMRSCCLHSGEWSGLTFIPRRVFPMKRLSTFWNSSALTSWNRRNRMFFFRFVLVNFNSCLLLTSFLVDSFLVSCGTHCCGPWKVLLSSLLLYQMVKKRASEKRDLDERWVMRKHHTHTHTNLFLSQSSKGGGGIHLFRSRSDHLSLGRKSTCACSLKFRGTDSIGCKESGYNPRGSQSLSDAMQWDNQQSINQ